MAIPFLKVSTISRGAQKSVVAAAAYRAGETLVNPYDGVVHDYTRRQKHAVALSGLTGWRGTRQQLWGRTEHLEQRVNSRLAVELIVALPAELDTAQREGLIQHYTEDLHKRYGTAVDWSIHTPSADGDRRNHHAHILVGCRAVGPDRLSLIYEDDVSGKRRVKGKIGRVIPLNGPEEVEAWRQRWQLRVNAALARANQRVVIDMRSHKRRGTGEAPQQHQGPALTAVRRKRRRLVREIHRLLIEERPTARLARVAEVKAVRREKWEAASWIKQARQREEEQERRIKAQRAEYDRGVAAQRAKEAAELEQAARAFRDEKAQQAAEQAAWQRAEQLARQEAAAREAERIRQSEIAAARKKAAEQEAKKAAEQQAKRAPEAAQKPISLPPEISDAAERPFGTTALRHILKAADQHSRQVPPPVRAADTRTVPQSLLDKPAEEIGTASEVTIQPLDPRSLSIGSQRLAATLLMAAERQDMNLLEHGLRLAGKYMKSPKDWLKRLQVWAAQVGPVVVHHWARSLVMTAQQVQTMLGGRGMAD
ncbi:MobA/MobL family protein [Microvirga sp. 3-52]|nr:MobA/MobL family protein [Microvirga sp. 3-52]